MMDYEFPLTNEPYNRATATGQQQTWLQIMLKELEDLHKTWLQEHLRLIPWNQQRLLKNAMELRDQLKLTRDTPPELPTTRGFRRLRELWELPDEIIKDLQELLQASKEQEELYELHGDAMFLPNKGLQEQPL